MTQTTRTEYAKVRSGMTVTTYSGQPIRVTAARHVVRLIAGRAVPAVGLSGWAERAQAPFEYIEYCYQLPHRRTELLADTGTKRRFWATFDMDDAAMHRTAHSYSPRYLELDLNIRIELFDSTSSDV